MEKLYCPIRKIWLQKRPEEVVRQNILHAMIHEWGFPQELISCEKELKELCPHGSSQIPPRRLDIVAFYAVDASLSPLLLIECKATKISEKAIRQLLGYNFNIGAPFIAIGTPDGLFCWKAFEEKPFDKPPSFQNLQKWAKGS